MSLRATDQPSARNLFATARPMPRRPPVTSTTPGPDGVTDATFDSGLPHYPDRVVVPAQVDVPTRIDQHVLATRLPGTAPQRVGNPVVGPWVDVLGGVGGDEGGGLDRIGRGGPV